MTQSVKTRAALLTRLNARTEVFIAKLDDETRINGVTSGPDADLTTPVIPGLYLLDLMFVFRAALSPAGSNGILFAFTGPLGITDGGFGAFSQIGTPQRNAPNTGLATVTVGAIGAPFVNTNVYINQSGWFAVREPGDLTLEWTSRVAGLGVTLQRGSSLHLVRAINDGDA